MEASRKTLVPVVSSSTAPNVTMRKAMPCSLAEYARLSFFPNTTLLYATTVAARLSVTCR